MVKDLLDVDLDGHVISFLGETANIARPDTNTRRPFVGMRVIYVKIEIIVIMPYVIWVLVLV